MSTLATSFLLVSVKLYAGLIAFPIVAVVRIELRSECPYAVLAELGCTGLAKSVALVEMESP